MVFLAQHLQLVEGLSPLWVGLALVPGVVAATVSFPLSPLVVRRLQPAYLISGGLLVTVLGLLLITRSDAARGSCLHDRARRSGGCGQCHAVGIDHRSRVCPGGSG